MSLARAPRRGFTLIEMLAALALAALLMGVLLTVAVSIGRSRQTMRDRPFAAPREVDRLRSLLRRDLAQAAQWQPAPAGLALRGPVALAPQTLKPTHQRATVVYEIKDLGGTRCLIRRQTRPDRSARGRRSRMLVLSDLRDFALTAGGTRRAGQGRPSQTNEPPDRPDADRAAPSAPASRAWRPVPAEMRLHVQWRDSAGEPIERRIIVR